MSWRNRAVLAEKPGSILSYPTQFFSCCASRLCIGVLACSRMSNKPLCPMSRGVRTRLLIKVCPTPPRGG